LRRREDFAGVDSMTLTTPSMKADIFLRASCSAFLLGTVVIAISPLRMASLPQPGRLCDYAGCGTIMRQMLSVAREKIPQTQVIVDVDALWLM
jgi:hypothetical protein